MWTARVFTLYPEFFPGLLGIGLYKKALEKKLWSLEVVNIRDFSLDKHKTVDDTPFGGGSGMLMRADVVANALDKSIPDKNEPIIYLSPKGKKFDQNYAKKIMQDQDLILGKDKRHTAKIPIDQKKAAKATIRRRSDDERRSGSDRRIN